MYSWTYIKPVFKFPEEGFVKPSYFASVVIFASPLSIRQSGVKITMPKLEILQSTFRFIQVIHVNVCSPTIFWLNYFWHVRLKRSKFSKAKLALYSAILKTYQSEKTKFNKGENNVAQELNYTAWYNKTKQKKKL